jgi:vacuolar-type H+-ATPase subunit I/STV1
VGILTFAVRSLNPEVKMKFSKIIFWIAAIWGVLILTPLYFMFDAIARQDPPPITHPAFYYGFVGIGLAWQFAFVVIARDPVRFRPMMIPSVIEKFSYTTALIVLYLQHRLHPTDLMFAGIDFLLGILFLFAFFKTAP